MVIADILVLQYFEAIPNLVYTELGLMDFIFEFIQVIVNWFVLAISKYFPNIRGAFYEAFQVILNVVNQVTWNLL